MLRKALTAWLFALTAMVAGCPKDALRPPATTQEADPGVLARQVKDLQEDIDALKKEKLVLAARVEELVEREKALSNALKDAQFDKQMQLRQIEALSSVPADRDRYRRRAEALSLEVERLEKELADLGAPTRPSSTMPSTAAATRPSPTATRPAAD